MFNHQEVMRPSTGSAPSGENLRCTDWAEPEDNREAVCLALGEAGAKEL